MGYPTSSKKTVSPRLPYSIHLPASCITLTASAASQAFQFDSQASYAELWEVVGWRCLTVVVSWNTLGPTMYTWLAINWMIPNRKWLEITMSIHLLLVGLWGSRLKYLQPFWIRKVCLAKHKIIHG